MTRRPLTAPALVLAATAAVAAFQLTGGGGAVRVAVTLLFLALAPGLPFTPALPGEGVARVTVAVALSFAIDALVVTALLAAGIYDPVVAFGVLAVVALAGSALTWRANRGATVIRLHPS
jgi:hypothetical protein